MRKNVVTVFVLLLFCHSLAAQDKVYRKNGQIIKAKILEIGSTEIKYKVFGMDEGPVYVLETDRISKIEFENGKVEKFTPNLKDPEQYEGQLRKAIKVDFLGPLLGYTQVTYEKSTGVGKSLELTLGIIGAGKNQTLEWYNNTLETTKRNQFGLSAGVGYKFSKLPDFLLGRTRYTHLLQGAYARPVFYIGNYSENVIVYKASTSLYSAEKHNTTFAALQLELGKQWIFADRVAMDMYWGFGYGFDNKGKKDSYYDDSETSAYNYINARVGRSPGLSFTFGIKVGGLLK